MQKVLFALFLVLPFVYWNLREPTAIGDETSDRSLNPRIGSFQAGTSGSMCLTFDETFDDLVASSGSIYVAAPSKAAGSTLQTFVQECVGEYVSENVGHVKAFTSESIEDRTEVFLENFKIPKIMTSHIRSDTSLINLIQQSPRDALFIYSYREETDRLLSAIRHVMEYACVGRHRREEIPFTEVKVDGDNCVINEAAIVNFALKPKAAEIGVGAPEIMTCRFYEAIETNFPRMVFLHYKQVDRLQKLLAKYHCPELLETPFRKNMAVDKRMTVSVRLQNDDEVVKVEDWFEAKRDKIEWTFNMKGGGYCQGKTRKMEDDLFACKDEALHVTRNTSF